MTPGVGDIYELIAHPSAKSNFLLLFMFFPGTTAMIEVDGVPYLKGHLGSVSSSLL